MRSDAMRSGAMRSDAYDRCAVTRCATTRCVAMQRDVTLRGTINTSHRSQRHAVHAHMHEQIMEWYTIHSKTAKDTNGAGNIRVRNTLVIVRAFQLLLTQTQTLGSQQRLPTAKALALVLVLALARMAHLRS